MNKASFLGRVSLIKILKCNCREKKGEDFKTQQVYFQADNHAHEDSDEWKLFLYQFSTKPIIKARS